LLIGNRLLRQALSSILQKTVDTFVAGESAAAADLFALIASLDVGVILADSVISFPSDFDVINEMQRLYPTVKIVMIGMELNESTFLTAVRAGVSGYLLNDASATELIGTIRAVMRGEAICPPSLCSALFKVVARREGLIPSSENGSTADTPATRTGPDDRPRTDELRDCISPESFRANDQESHSPNTSQGWGERPF
jgi:DNA-binding NarL/FixJ family response regulator